MTTGISYGYVLGLLDAIDSLAPDWLEPVPSGPAFRLAVTENGLQDGQNLRATLDMLPRQHDAVGLTDTGTR